MPSTETRPAPVGEAPLSAAVEALEGRIARLEETAFFQEERLKELDSALTAQQAQLDAMERQLADTPENALPPHSMPERY